MTTMEKGASATHVGLRIGAGLLFMFHGAQKLLGWFGGMGEGGGTAELVSQMGLAGVLEVFGGALIVVGLFVRPVALVLVLEMIVAYVQVHAPQALLPIQNQGELALLYALTFLYFAGNGAGAVSVDALRHRPREERSVPALTSEEKVRQRRRVA
jgi:putative oxidoreductase